MRDGLKEKHGQVYRLEAILIAFCCTFYIGVSFGQSDITVRVMDGIAPLVFVASLLMHDKKGSAFKTKTLSWGTLLLACGALSIVLAMVTDRTWYLLSWLKLLRLSMIFMMAYAASQWDTLTAAFFVQVLLWLGTVQAIFALLMYVLQVPAFYASQTKMVNGILLHRASGFVADAGAFGILCALLSCIALAAFLWKIPKCKAIAIACFIANVAGLIASDTRTAMIALLIGTVSLFFSRCDRNDGKKQKMLLYWIGGAILFIVSAALLLTVIAPALCDAGEKATAFLLMETGKESTALYRVNTLLSERLRIWLQYMICWFRQSPVMKLLGNGYYLYEEKMQVYSIVDGKQVFGRPTHSQYLSVLIGMGLSGWICFCALLMSVTRLVSRKAKGGNFFCACARALLLAEMLVMCIDDALGMVNSSALVFVFLAVIAHQNEETLNSQPENITFYCDHWQNGGVESYLMNLLRNGKPTDVLCTLVTADKTTDIYDEELTALHVAHTVLLQHIYSSPVARILHTFSALRNYLNINACDVVYFNLTNSVTMRYAKIAQQAGVKRCIVHSHCADVQPGMSRVIKRVGSLVARQLYISAVTDCWACSDKAGEWMFPKRLQNKIVFIPNAIQTPKFAFDEEGREQIRRQLGAEDKTVVGTIGRCVSEKNQIFLLQAFANYHQQHEDSVLLLVGDGPLRNDLETKAKAFGVWQACVFYGSVSAAKVPPLLWAMDLFCLPSILEGNPVSGIEAQAAGCRCLFSDNITRQAKILPDTIFLSIENGTKIWSQAMSHILEQKCDRRTASAKVCDAGYDVASSSLKTWTMLESYK